MRGTRLIGQTLSHYRITDALGAGGMGEVYRATDTNLNREVALKVLPRAVVEDPDRLARFRREAHLLASLNHPAIAAVYGFEEVDGIPFLAMELVEGETLEDRLRRGPLPVEEALEIAGQIAEALEEAHRRNIVHRDLKPANVQRTPEGKVKVLDFGLAKAWAGEVAQDPASTPAVSQSPTLAFTGTVAGVILGTAAYMSPEQARGKPVDRRADIWSFGVLLWELLTGRQLFSGETVTDILAAVVKSEPDLDALPSETPPAVRRLLVRCLRKDPRLRLPDIGTARLELWELATGSTPEAAAPGAEVREALRDERRGRRRERWIWAAGALLAAGLLAVLPFFRPTESDREATTVQFDVAPPEEWTFPSRFSVGWPAPSPEGRRIVFRALPPKGTDGESMLWIRSLDSMDVRPLPGTEGGVLPFWSPDGRSLAFFAHDELRRLDLAAGTVQRICSAEEAGFGGGTWNEEGTILFSRGPEPSRIYSVAAGGGDAEFLTGPDVSRGETYFHFPWFLPDGRRFLFRVAATDENVAGVYVASLDEPGDKRRVAPLEARVAHASGHLLFMRDRTLFAQPFDDDRTTTTGPPVSVASPVVAWFADPAIGYFGVASGRTLAFFSGTASSEGAQLAWVDRQGRTTESVGQPGYYFQLALSPDGRNVALEVAGEEGGIDLWVMELARGVASRVTGLDGHERDPVWSPDGRSLAFLALGAETGRMRRKAPRLTAPETAITETADENHPEFWSEDGTTLLYVHRTPENEQSVWALDVASGLAEEVLGDRFRVDEPQLSPDGRWLAYVSTESGRDEVYLEPFRGEGDRVQVSVDGGGQPKWRSDGRELFYVTPTDVLVAVEVADDGERLEVSLPNELFELYGVQGSGYDDYAPSPDGQRFLVKQPVGETPETRLRVVTDWTSLLD